MQFLSRLKISTKILGLLLMLGLVTLSVALYGSRTLVSMNAQYNDLVDVQLPGTVKLARANRQVVEMVYAGYRALSYAGQSAEARATIDNEQQAYEAASAGLAEVLKAEPDMASTLAEIRTRLDHLHALTKEATRLGVDDRNDEARAALVKADEEARSLIKFTTDFNEKRLAESDKDSDVLGATASSTSTMLISFSLIGLLVALGVAMWVSRGQIGKPIAELEGTMGALAEGKVDVDVAGHDRGDEIGAMARAVLVFRDAAVAQRSAAVAKERADADQRLVVETLESNLTRLSEGDLTAQIDTRFAAEYETLRANFNATVGTLRDLIGSVIDTAATIETGSNEIARASEDLARRTEANAASLEETSAAIGEMDGRLKTSASASGTTVARADAAITVVGQGRGTADEAVQAMGRVAESAKGIDSVIEGLDKIAFQTRVLAMNAAVEAGRAGEAGRGFAVVADLVSALAMRAEEEAGRARDQLTATQADITTAVEMVQKVDGALADIVGDVGEVHRLLGGMANDNQAQATAVTQINSAIGSLDQSTQQNAAMVEETSAAARNLLAEVAALSERAARFNVGGAPAAKRPSPAAIVAAAKPVSFRKAANGHAHEEWASF